ncbi:SusC/RagA family TonB-linked outer membrane protein [Sinomicrobium weinanense]|uniref:TonB-dependent receptor n=1 Tax=Sinomicrobium weinanense TaxID=2842200 RepID=A0A926Q4S4_9FLAO|nr:TonB-dependent receptor [Sinomicrobium weinanense]MBC9797396.1 TonB-dependent receptor [Sinomicrobium weinanense]MBU3124551.1 TonB-dependent receptor [Sinomicrobium weinanense]
MTNQSNCTYVLRSRKGFLTLLVLAFAFEAWAQTINISGTVSDDQGSLPGVSVVVKGTATGAATDFDGNYTLDDVPANATLRFTYVGYQPLEIEVNSQTVINATLVTDTKQLEEVVVVGYGTQRKEAVTGSVVSVSGDEMREVASPNISQALQGRMPGVDISQTSSQPGTTMQIRIRGTRSLTASNDPLVVLNGIPFTGSIGDINPEDIKSIDILKDASATAIYGSRGANGVILVTTKRGYKGQEAKISYNGYFGTRSIFARYPMMNGPDFIALRQAAGQFTNGADESENVDTDWQDLMYRTGIVTSHDVSVTGGSEKGSYNFGLGYYRDEGVIPTQQYNRISLRAAIDQEIGRHFRIGLNSNTNYNITEGSQVGLYGILSMSPLADPYNEDGTWKRTVNMPLDEAWVYSRNILGRLDDRWLNETRSFATYNAIYGEVRIPGVEGLKYRVNLGLDYRQSNEGAYTGRGINSANPETLSTASVSNSHTYHWIVENLLTYDRTFAEKHNVNITALYSAEQTKYTRSRMAARDIPSDQFRFYNLGHANGEITIDPDDQIYELSGLMSWMGRVMYSYDNRYMLSATVRSDGSSRLAKGHKWHTYPAVSAGWNIGNESFMDKISLVNTLKLRVGYGQTSNQAISPYATLGRLGTRPYNFGNDNYATGYYVSELPNSGLGWEYSETWNYGLDFSLWNNRLSGSLEYYVTDTKDILLGVNLPPTTGVGSYTANIGETRNKGLELSLNGLIVDTEDWTWEAGLNIYGNRNELVALSSGQERDEGNWWFVGHPINVIYDYEYTGLWQEDDPYLDILEPGGNVGMIKVKYTGDYNEDGTPARAIGPEDRQIMDLQPDFQGGFNTRVAYKGFDLSLVGAFKSGGVLISTLHSSSGYLNMLSGRRNNVKVDYWTPENTDARYPKPGGVASGDNPKYGSTLGYFDASYLKIRTMTLGYNFDGKSWMEKAGISRLRLYTSIQNPFVMFSPYHRKTGLDPETNSYADENAAVTGTYPSRLLTIGTNAPATRNYMVGINLTF